MFSVNLGLSFIGDETSYKELLLEFKNGFINQMNEIRTLYENKDIENYGVKVHALKSNCKTTLIISQISTTILGSSFMLM